MAVISFPGHKLYQCDGVKCLDRSSCVFCDAGLSFCVTCHGAEGSMPTDCPGHIMPAELEDAVYAGECDFRRGQGWITLQKQRVSVVSTKLSPQGWLRWLNEHPVRKSATILHINRRTT